MTDGAADDLRAARFWLRNRQRAWAQVTPPLGTLDGLRVALGQVDKRAAAAVPDGADVVVEGFRFDAAREARRLDRTREILRRTDPGPYEDGVKLELLARQAATIELTLLEAAQRVDADDSVARALDHVILGTTGQQRHDAVTTHIGRGCVIALSDGMMTAYYQAAKAVVLAWPGTGEDGRDGLSGSLDRIAAGLRSDRRPTLQLEETLGNWFYSGRPLPQRSSAPQARQRVLALTVLISCMERFVLAHEYAHALFDQLDVPTALTGGTRPGSAVEQEIRADTVAAELVMASGAEWDRFAPNMSLQAAPLAVRIHDIVQEALGIAGRPEARPAESHPPLEQRRRMIVDYYLDHYHDEGLLDVAGLLVASDTVDLLWRHARPPLSTWLTSGRPFHPTWDQRPDAGRS